MVERRDRWGVGAGRKINKIHWKVKNKNKIKLGLNAGRSGLFYIGHDRIVHKVRSKLKSVAYVNQTMRVWTKKNMRD